jgi:hypothetical protein
MFMELNNPAESEPKPTRKTWQTPICTKKNWQTPQLVSIAFGQTRSGTNSFHESTMATVS